MKKLIVFPIFILLAACGQNKNIAQNKEDIEVVSPADVDTAISKTVSGTVTEIQLGKDGYTAKLQTKEELIYWVTISHSNLENPQQYQMLTAGEQLTVKGDFWKMNDENHLTVRSIL